MISWYANECCVQRNVRFCFSLHAFQKYNITLFFIVENTKTFIPQLCLHYLEQL